MGKTGGKREECSAMMKRSGNKPEKGDGTQEGEECHQTKRTDDSSSLFFSHTSECRDSRKETTTSFEGKSFSRKGEQQKEARGTK